MQVRVPVDLRWCYGRCLGTKMGNAMHIKSKKHGDIERLGVSVEEMGRALGIGRNAAYEAVRRGDIPAIRIGRRLIVPIEALRKKLEEAAK